MDSVEKKIVKEAETSERPTRMDIEIQRLRQVLRETPVDGLKGTIRAMINMQDQRDYFKMKEFFLNVCESFKDLPESLTGEDIDQLIESFLQICQNYPSPLSSRGFMVFFNFLVNKDRKAGNGGIAERFKLNKQNLARLGVENYLEDKTLSEFAVNYALFFMLRFDAAIHQITEQPKFIEMINWCDKRNLHKAVSHNLEHIAEVRAEVKNFWQEHKQSMNHVFTEISQMKGSVEACLREVQHVDKRISTVEKNTDELNALLQEDKRFINVIEEKLEATESQVYKMEGVIMEKLGEFEKSVLNDHDLLQKLAENEPNTDRRLQELEKNLDEHDGQLEEQSQDIKSLLKVKFSNEEVELSVARLKEISKKTETNLENSAVKFANLMREQDKLKEDLTKATLKMQVQEERLAQVQTNAKNNFDKLIEENEMLVGAYNKSTSEFSGRVDSGERKILEVQKRIEEVFESIKGLQSKENLEAIIKTQQESISLASVSVAELKSLTSAHEKSIEGLLSLCNENKTLIVTKNNQANELSQKQSEVAVDLQSLKKEILFLRDRQQVGPLSSTSTELDGFPAVVKRLEQIKYDLIQQIDDASRKMLGLEEQFNSKLEGVRQSTMDSVKQLKDRIATEVNQREHAIGKINELVSKELNHRLEQLSDGVSRLNNEHQSFNDKLKAQETHIISLQKTAQLTGNQLGDLSQHFGVTFDNEGEIQLYEKDSLSLERGSFEGKNLSNNQVQDRLELIKKHMVNVNMEMRNISNKLPLYQKKLVSLTNLYNFLLEFIGHSLAIGESLSAGDSATMQKALSQQLKKLENNPVITTDDVSQALKITKSKFTSDIENVLNLIAKLQKTLDERHGVTNQHIAELEGVIQQNIDERGLSLKISSLSKDVSSLQQNWEKFKDNEGQTQVNLQNYQDTFLDTYKYRIEKIESDIEFLSKKPENSLARKLNVGFKPDLLDISSVADSPYYDTSKSTASDIETDQLPRATFMRDVKAKLISLDFIANDYLHAFIESEAFKCNLRLHKTAISLDDKFDSMLFFVKHYKIIEERLIKSSLQQFYEILTASRNNPRLNALRYEHFPEVLVVMKKQADVEFENFYYVCETFYLFLSDEENMKKCEEGSLFSSLVLLTESASNKINILSSLIKLLSAFVRQDEFRDRAIAAKMMTKFIKITQPLLEYFIKDPRSLLDHTQDLTLSIIAEERIAHADSASELRLSGLHRSPNSTVKLQKDSLDPRVISRKMNIENPFKRDEITFYAIYLLYNCFLNEQALRQCNYQGVFLTLMKIVKKKHISKTILEVALHTLKLITQMQDINYKQLDELEYFKALIHIAGERISHNECNLLAYDILSNMSIHPDVYEVIRGLEDFDKLSFSVPTQLPISHLSKTIFQLHALQHSPFDKISNNITAEKPPVYTGRRPVPLVLRGSTEAKTTLNPRQAHTPPGRRRPEGVSANPRGKSSSKKALNTSLQADFRPTKSGDFDPFKSELNLFSSTKNKSRFRTPTLPSILIKERKGSNDSEVTRKVTQAKDI